MAFYKSRGLQIGAALLFGLVAFTIFLSVSFFPSNHSLNASSYVSFPNFTAPFPQTFSSLTSTSDHLIPSPVAVTISKEEVSESADTSANPTTDEGPITDTSPNSNTRTDTGTNTTASASATATAERSTDKDKVTDMRTNTNTSVSVSTTAERSTDTDADTDTGTRTNTSISTNTSNSVPAKSTSSSSNSQEEYPRLTGNATCILYDRPPRTGSTTISRALQSCLGGRGFSRPKGISKELRAEVIRRMLRHSNDRLSAVTTHMYMSLQDVDDIGNRCKSFLYITGCAPVKSRIYSAAKYAATQADNKNSTVGDDAEARILSYLKYHTDDETGYESYPYKSNMDPMPFEKRLVPDYVIRKENVAQDLPPLMRALGCPGKFVSNNIHAASSELEAKILKQISVTRGDALYHWLMEISKRNAEGLEKALLFQ